MNIIRQPDEWARDWGWVSRRRAVNAARKLNEIATAIEIADDGGDWWAQEIRRVAKSIAPEKIPAEKKRTAREVAAMREP